MKSEELSTLGLPPPSTSSTRDGEKTNIFRKILWKLSTRKLKATFLNGKRLTIQYIFDSTRPNRENVLIKLDCLSPIFGGTVPASLSRFSSITELCIFVKMEVHLDECEDGRRAYCPHHPLHDCGEFYGIIKPVVDECLHQHFHHCCWEHVVSWFYNYLNLLILLRESKELFDQEIAEIYSFFPDDIRYFQTGNRATPEFLLKTAVEVNAALYEIDDE